MRPTRRSQKDGYIESHDANEPKHIALWARACDRTPMAQPKVDDTDELRALVPFTVGGAELMLVPNQPDGAQPSVLLIVRHREGVISEQLPLARVYRLAAHLILAAADAEVLASSDSSARWVTTPDQSKTAAERHHKSLRSDRRR